MNNLSRRGFLGLSTVAVLAAAGCQSAGGEAEPGGQSPAVKSFEFTDARGKTVELPSLPKTVVAQSSVAAALWDLGYRVKGIYGELQERDGELDYQAGSIELDGLTVLGKTYGQFDIEQYAAMEPDLIIDMTYDMKSLWYAGEVEPKISELAPSIGMQLVGLSVVEQLQKHTELATALGADLEAAGVPQAKKDFEAAGAKLTAATEAKPDVTVLALSFGEAGQVHLSDPKAHPDLAHLAELGVRFPDVQGDDGGPFQLVSLENLSDYPADVIIVDARNYWAEDYDRAQRQAVWKNLPAVKAGQVHEWYPLAPFSYPTYTKLLTDYAAHIEQASPVK